MAPCIIKQHFGETKPETQAIDLVDIMYFQSLTVQLKCLIPFLLQGVPLRENCSAKKGLKLYLRKNNK